MQNMSWMRITDSPLPWAFIGLTIGVVLGVTVVSAWIIAAGFLAYIIYLKWHGHAYEKTETNLFFAGPTFLIAWVLGFIIKDLI